MTDTIFSLSTQYPVLGTAFVAAKRAARNLFAAAAITSDVPAVNYSTNHG